MAARRAKFSGRQETRILREKEAAEEGEPLKENLSRNRKRKFVKVLNFLLKRLVKKPPEKTKRQNEANEHRVRRRRHHRVRLRVTECSFTI